MLYVWFSRRLNAPLHPGQDLMIRPRGQLPRRVAGSTRRTRSSWWRFRCGVVHFLRLVKAWINSRIHLRQKWSAETWACRQRFREGSSLSVKRSGGKFGLAWPSNKWFGVKGSGSEGSMDKCVKGRLFIRTRTLVHERSKRYQRWSPLDRVAVPETVEFGSIDTFLRTVHDKATGIQYLSCSQWAGGSLVFSLSMILSPTKNMRHDSWEAIDAERLVDETIDAADR